MKSVTHVRALCVSCVCKIGMCQINITEPYLILKPEGSYQENIGIEKLIGKLVSSFETR